MMANGRQRFLSEAGRRLNRPKWAGGAMKRNAFLAYALVSALVSQRLWAQGVGASGDIKGTVADSSGAIITRANIIATETAKGARRAASTDGSGSFLITGLEPATYDVSVQITGFAT